MEVNLGSGSQSLHYYHGCVLRCTGERYRGYALLMTANKPETALYRAPTFSLLLVSRGGSGHGVKPTTVGAV